VKTIPDSVFFKLSLVPGSQPLRVRKLDCWKQVHEIAELFDSAKLVTDVGTVLPLGEASVAHEMLAGAPHKRGKIVAGCAQYPFSIDHLQRDSPIHRGATIK